MDYNEWIKANPPETWVKYLKDRGAHYCDLCKHTKIKFAKVFVPPDDRQPVKGRQMFAIYGLCSDCFKKPGSFETIERKLLEDLPKPKRVFNAETGMLDALDKVFVKAPPGGTLAFNINTGTIEQIKDTSDSYYVVTGPGSARMYLHPHEEIGYTLQPERFGAAVFRLVNAKKLIEELKRAGVCMRKGKQVDADWNLEPEHVLAHNDSN